MCYLCIFTVQNFCNTIYATKLNKLSLEIYFNCKYDLAVL